MFILTWAGSTITTAFIVYGGLANFAFVAALLSLRKAPNEILAESAPSEVIEERLVPAVLRHGSK